MEVQKMQSVSIRFKNDNNEGGYSCVSVKMAYLRKQNFYLDIQNKAQAFLKGIDTLDQLCSRLTMVNMLLTDYRILYNMGTNIDDKRRCLAYIAACSMVLNKFGLLAYNIDIGVYVCDGETSEPINCNAILSDAGIHAGLSFAIKNNYSVYTYKLNG